MTEVLSKRVIKNAHKLDTVKHQKGSIDVPTHQTEADVSHMAMDSYSPQSGATLIMQSQTAIVDFMVYPGTVAEVRLIALCVPVTNGSTTLPLYLTNPLYWCQSNPIQLSLDGSEICLFYSEGQQFAFSTMNYEETKIMSKLINGIFSNTLATTSKNVPASTFGADEIISVAPGETRNFYIPLLNDPFIQTKIPMNAITSKIRYRFQFDPYQNVTISKQSSSYVVSDLKVGNLQLYIMGLGHGDPRSTNLIVPKLDGSLSATYYKRERQIISQGVYVAGQTLNNTMSSLSGFYSCIVNYIRSQGALKEKAYQFSYDTTSPYTPESFIITASTLYDSSRRPIEVVAIPTELKRYGEALVNMVDNNGLNVSTYSSKYPYAIWSLGSSVFETARHGIVSGAIVNNAWSTELAGPIVDIPGTPPLELVILADRLFEFSVGQDGRAIAVPTTF